jgi:cytidine deaminase
MTGSWRPRCRPPALSVAAALTTAQAIDVPMKIADRQSARAARCGSAEDPVPTEWRDSAFCRLTVAATSRTLNRMKPFRESKDEETDAERALIAAASRAAENAYAPYSRFTVGAALQTKDGGVFVGCNVENASYPVGVCAERNAIAAAVSAEGPGMQIALMAVVARNAGIDAPCAPCGACRQAIQEFGRDANLIYRWPSLDYQRKTSAELLPDSFDFEHRLKARKP